MILPYYALFSGCINAVKRVKLNDFCESTYFGSSCRAAFNMKG